MKVDSIVFNAKQLVTCASDGKPKKGAAMQDLGIIENGAVAINEGVIVAIGNSDAIMNDYEAGDYTDALGRVVCPAFVECHTHVVYAGNRLNEFELKIKGADYLEILENGGGILSTVKQTREAKIDQLISESRKRLDKMLALGVGTSEIKTGYGLDAKSEIKMLQAILELDRTHEIDLIPTFLPAHAVPPEYKGNADDYIELICRGMLDEAKDLFAPIKYSSEISAEEKAASFGVFEITEALKNSALEKYPFFVDVFCEKGAFTLEQSRKVLEKAKSLGFKLKAHVDEFVSLGGARMAIELGATSIDHLDAISDEEIKLLAQSETIGVVTPTVNFNFGAKEFADARKMIDAGCAIAVSTDYNPGSAPCPSLPNAMAIACRYQKLLPSETLNAVTINAAHAVGMGDKVGSVEIGKQADLLVLETEDYRELAYEFGGNLVSSVIKKGKTVV
jgi:imidazolonepropionase